MKKWMCVLLLAGCPNNGPVFDGEKMLDYFPFEQNVDCKWSFAHDDTLLEHSMAAEITNFEFLDGGRDTFEVSFVKECRGQSDTCTEGDLIRRMYWEIQAGQGVRLTGMDAPGASYTFDPAIQLASSEMRVGAEIETTTGDATYTSTFIEIGDCPVPLETFDSCVKMQLASTDGVSEVLGTYWAINDFNIVAIDWPDQNGLWKLVRHETVE